ncbi:MAG TPA: class IV adenylate cyclase [Thermogutta sp.]|nr:class IV adenylate cyclase [Thermogutta sp.]HPU07628.1 class IV adenylate cyclase [Thermogutta sp.]HQF12502.1 class IV adenylate cyclase [Thermogutta sp.]
MLVEVELKFRVAEMEELARQLSSLATEPEVLKEERDLYFAHPVRDFSQTDEALRLRRSGMHNYITYKGPKIDTVSKTRYELDLPLLDGEDVFKQWCDLLEKLGFRPVAEVIKQRRKIWTQWEGWRVEISLDQVENVGQYVEFEIVCDEERVSQARDALLRLAESLQLTHSERRSYLELLLAERSPTHPPTTNVQG